MNVCSCKACPCKISDHKGRNYKDDMKKIEVHADTISEKENIYLL